jgi:hypothetical protein
MGVMQPDRREILRERKNTPAQSAKHSIAVLAEN